MGSNAGRSAFPVDVAGTFPESGKALARDGCPKKHEADEGGEKDFFQHSYGNQSSESPMMMTSLSPTSSGMLPCGTR